MAKFAPGNNANPSGRPKGSPNKATVLIKDAIERALKELEPVKYLKWLAKEEPRAFAMLVAKLIPHEVKADLGEGVLLKLRNYTGMPVEQLQPAVDITPSKPELEPGNGKT